MKLNLIQTQPKIFNIYVLYAMFFSNNLKAYTKSFRKQKFLIDLNILWVSHKTVSREDFGKVELVDFTVCTIKEDKLSPQTLRMIGTIDKHVR